VSGRGWFQNWLGSVGQKLAQWDSERRRRCACENESRHEQVLAALADERYQFRTVPNIAAETGISEDSVRSILEAHAADVRKLALHDGKGNVLYTLRSRPRTAREILAETRASLAGSSK
jgi:hypothetical protein